MSTEETTTKRFQYWQLTGQGKIVGLVPVPAGKKPGYFVDLEQDRTGKVVKVTEWVDGHVEPLVRRPTFQDGRLKFSEYSDPIRGRTGKNCYEYDERGFLKQRYELDPKGKVRFRVEIRCDERGNFAEEKVLDHRGRFKERRTYEHDAKGRLVKERVFGGKGGETLDGWFVLSYDARGNVVRRAWHGPDGQERRAFTYAYDAHDRRTKVAVEEAGAEVMSLDKELDDDGKVKATEYRDASGGKVAREVAMAPGQSVRSFLGTVPEHELNEIEKELLAGKKKLAEVLEISKKQLEALTMVAYSHLEGGRYTEARALFEALAALDQDDVYALAGAGAAALLQKQPNAAVAWYDRALDRDPGNVACLGGKAEALLRLGRTEDAKALFEQLFRTARPDDPTVRHAKELLLGLKRG